MTYRVQISRSAAKAITGLEKPVRRKVLAAIETLAENPRPPSCRKLVGQDAWRIRVADTYGGYRREIYR